MNIRQRIAQIIAGPSSKVVENEQLEDLARQIEDAKAAMDNRLEGYENDNRELSTDLYAYIKEGAALRNNIDGSTNRYPGNSVAHMLSATGWFTEDLRLALIKADPDGYGKNHTV